MHKALGFMCLFFTLLVAQVQARSGDASATSQFSGPIGKAGKCLRVGQTEQVGDERFHRIANVCEEDLVIFYCVVSTQPYTPEWGNGDCRAPKPELMAAWNRRAASLGMHVLEAPSSVKIARKNNSGWLESYRQFGAGIGHEDVDVSAVIADLGSSPLSLYTTRAGEAFVSGTTSYNSLALRSVAVPDACAIDEYLDGRCTPDPVKIWKRIGRPMTADAAIEGMRAAGLFAE